MDRHARNGIGRLQTFAIQSCCHSRDILLRYLMRHSSSTLRASFDSKENNLVCRPKPRCLPPSLTRLSRKNHSVCIEGYPFAPTSYFCVANRAP